MSASAVAKKFDTRKVDSDRYNAQCVTLVHVTSILPGSELEKRAIAREAEGYIDAIPIPADECWQCDVDKQENARQAKRMCDLVGCLEFDKGACKTECQAAASFYDAE